MPTQNSWITPASQTSLQKAVAALRLANIDSIVVANKKEAREKVLSLIPKGVEVMTMSSVTLRDAGIADALNSPEYNSVKTKLASMNREAQSLEMQKLGSAPEWAVGSVHAVTEDGKVLVVSNTGSQLSAYSYASPHVIWVVGTQKIVKDFDEGMKRIYEHTLPLEAEYAKERWGPNATTNVGKVLIINKEFKPGRITIVFIEEAIGF